MDISKFLDEIDHALMIKAVEHVMEEKWVKMYVERWLRTPVQKQDGTLQQKAGKGTPQGGVISPLLANLYLHFTLDMWLTKHYPQVNFVRYADDVVVHCTSKAEAERVLEAIKQRLVEVKLQIKEEKTRIAYCKDYRRKGRHEVVKFEFLGYSYQPRARKSNRDGKSFTAFAAEISQPGVVLSLENGILLKRIKNNTSRMTGDCHVRFCERLGGETPPCLLRGFV